MKPGPTAVTRTCWSPYSSAAFGDLLRAALTTELDELRERHLGADPDPAAVAEVTLGVVRHVASYRAIYRRGLAPDAGPGSLVTMLAEHFLASSRMLQEREVVGRPEAVGVDAATAAEAAAGFVAFGTVGAIRAWLEQSGALDPESFLALDAALVPTWWLGGGGS